MTIYLIVLILFIVFYIHKEEAHDWNHIVFYIFMQTLWNYKIINYASQEMAEEASKGETLVFECVASKLYKMLFSTCI